VSGVSKSYTLTVTGAQEAIGAPGGIPFTVYALQVKGNGGTLTSWTALLEGSLDRTNWTTLITHNASDGSTSFDTTGKPLLFVRVNLSALSLGTATSITLTMAAGTKS
jgi:hypothetical protein